MKKLFHLGIAALFVITVSSCSKSTNDLLPAKQKDQVSNVSAKIRSSNGGLLSGFSAATSWGDSKFYPLINQPYELALGDPDNSIIHTDGNEFVAVFLLVSFNNTEINAESAKLTATDDITGDIVSYYELIPGGSAADYGVKMPEGLDGQFTYFVVIPMADLVSHTENTVSLSSELTTANGTLTAQFDKAFKVMP